MQVSQISHQINLKIQQLPSSLLRRRVVVDRFLRIGPRRSFVMNSAKKNANARAVVKRDMRWASKRVSRLSLFIQSSKSSSINEFSTMQGLPRERCHCSQAATTDRKRVTSPRALCILVLSKFGDHLPLYREEDLFSPMGWLIRRSTICDWLYELGLLIEPLVMRMKHLVLQSSVIHTDDTKIKMLDVGICTEA